MDIGRNLQNLEVTFLRKNTYDVAVINVTLSDTPQIVYNTFLMTTTILGFGFFAGIGSDS